MFTVYIKMADGNPEIPFVKKVSFQLHSTFTPSKAEFSNPPFALTRVSVDLCILCLCCIRGVGDLL